LTFYFSAGNIASGNFKLYGIKWKKLLMELNTL
jgi:hypothetical protein